MLKISFKMFYSHIYCCKRIDDKLKEKPELTGSLKLLSVFCCAHCLGALVP